MSPHFSGSAIEYVTTEVEIPQRLARESGEDKIILRTCLLADAQSVTEET